MTNIIRKISKMGAAAGGFLSRNFNIASNGSKATAATIGGLTVLIAIFSDVTAGEAAALYTVNSIVGGLIGMVGGYVVGAVQDIVSSRRGSGYSKLCR